MERESERYSVSLNLEPLEHFRPHGRALLEILGVRPQPPHLLQNRAEYARGTLRHHPLLVESLGFSVQRLGCSVEGQEFRV